MERVPVLLSVVFGLVTGLTVWLFYRAARPARPTLYVLLGWLGLQGALGLSGFYAAAPQALPPRLLLALAPPIGLIATLFISARGRAYLDGLPLKTLTLLHTVRVLVELALLGLFLHQAVPQLLTFEGRNWDIFSGLSAPLVYYLVFKRRLLGPRALLGWNIVCLGLLLNVVINALLSVPSPIQQFAFAQPNIAVLHFPFVWLPSCVVPLVLLAHLAAIRQLTRRPQA